MGLCLGIGLLKMNGLTVYSCRAWVSFLWLLHFATFSEQVWHIGGALLTFLRHLSRDSISLREMNAPCARAVLSPFLALNILVHMK